MFELHLVPSRHGARNYAEADGERHHWYPIVTQLEAFLSQPSSIYVQIPKTDATTIMSALVGKGMELFPRSRGYKRHWQAFLLHE